ncbi:MAG: hypothetical protein KAU31_06740, partial [Spirochaetaceae bacterium]|nr:hypothetical protein [Spirochaetaceae bacterium]
DLGDTGGTVGLVLDDAWVDASFTTSLNGAADTNIIYLETAGTWNTDADGMSAGDLLAPGESTDSHNATQSIDVPLHFLKGLFTDAQSRNAVPGHGGDVDAVNPDNAAGYTDTQDFTAPVLVAVEAGRHEHDDAQGNPALYDAWDGHNYFELKYSEPVDFGTGAANNYLQSGADDGSIADDALTRRATAAFAAAGERGAYIYDDDPGATGLPGTVFVEGYFNYAGEFDGGSLDGNPATSSLYRYPGLSSSDTHHLRIFVKGWSEDLVTHLEWKGYVDNATDPVLQTISVPANPLITDDSPANNAVLSSTDPRYIEPVIAGTTLVAPFDQALDFDPPAVALFRPNDQNSPYHEILVTLDLINDPAANPDYYNRLEFHIQDNVSELGSWVSIGAPAPDHPDNRDDYGIRDYAVRDAIGAFFVTPEGVDFNPGTPVDWHAVVVGNDPPPGPPPRGFYTTVDNFFYTGGPGFPLIDLDDSYFSLVWDNLLFPQLQVQTSIWVAYQPTPAVTGATEIITDLAGNRLPEFERYINIEREPPTIVVALAAVGGDRIYIQFSEPVGAVLGPGPLLPGNIALTTAGGLSVDTIDAIASVAGPGFDYVEEAWLNLSGTITADVAFTGRIGPSGANVIEDPFATDMAPDEINRLTDIGINLVVPVEAWNDIQDDDTFGDEFMGV